jgi:hypothetical protein
MAASGGEAFYGAATGVLPLVFISLVFEARSVWRPDRRLADALGISETALVLVRAAFALALTTVLGIGGAAAFVGLSHPSWEFTFETGATAWIVAWALIIGTGSILALPLLRGVAELAVRMAPSLSINTRRGVVAFGVLATAAVLYVIYSIGVQALLH